MIWEAFMKRIWFIIAMMFVSMLYVPVHATDTIKEESFDTVQSEYVSIWNVEEEKVLYEKQAQKRMYPASLTKIMTTLVALEAMDDLHETITLNEAVFEGLEEANASVAGYRVGDQATLEDLLYGIMLPSGADAARAIAIHCYGSEAAFVNKMNEKAASLNLSETHFTNTTGLHDNDHYSSAADLSIILREALKNETFQTIFEAPQYETSDHTKVFYATRVSAISLAGINEDFLTGSKTGYTLEGGLCLASTMEANGAHYIVITGNAGNDYATLQHIQDAYTIYQTLSSQYQLTTLYSKMEVIQEVPVKYGNEDHVPVVAYIDIEALNKIGEELDLEFNIDDVIAGVKEGDELGELNIVSPSLEITHSYTLFANADVSRDWIAYLLHAWWFYVVILLGILWSILFMIRRHHLKKLRAKKARKRNN